MNERNAKEESKQTNKKVTKEYFISRLKDGVLNLSYSIDVCIDDESMSILQIFIQENHHSVRELHLASCLFTDKGLKILTEELKNNQNIFLLDLSLNSITSDGLASLLSCLDFNIALKTIKLDGLRYNDNLDNIDSKIKQIRNKLIQNDYNNNLVNLTKKNISSITSKKKEGVDNENNKQLLSEAKIYYQQAGYTSAIKIYDKILTNDQGNIDALHGKGLALLEKNHLTAANECFESIKKNIQNSVSDLDHSFSIMYFFKDDFIASLKYMDQQFQKYKTDDYLYKKFLISLFTEKELSKIHVAQEANQNSNLYAKIYQTVMSLLNQKDPKLLENSLKEINKLISNLDSITEQLFINYLMAKIFYCIERYDLSLRYIFSGLRIKYDYIHCQIFLEKQNLQELINNNKIFAENLFSSNPQEFKADIFFEKNSDHLNKSQQSLLHLAIVRKSPIFEKIMNSALIDLDIQDKSGQTVLHYATQIQDTHCMSLLLNKNANPNLCDRRGNMPIHIAVMTRNLNAIKLLRQRGAHINERNQEGDTPFHLAIRDSYNEIIEYMLNCNINYKIANNLGELPLVHVQNIETAKLIYKFIKDSQEINFLMHAKDNLDNTWLHTLAKLEFNELTELLIDKVADISARNKHRETPLSIAISFNRDKFLTFCFLKNLNTTSTKNENIFHLLASCNLSESIIKNVSHYIVNSNYSQIKLLLRERNHTGFTPLHLAVSSSNNRYIECLFTFKGINECMNQKTSKETGQDTALHLSVKKGDLNTVSLLIDKGCDLFIVNGNGLTVLDYAESLSQLENTANFTRIKRYLKQKIDELATKIITASFFNSLSSRKLITTLEKSFPIALNRSKMGLKSYRFFSSNTSTTNQQMVDFGKSIAINIKTKLVETESTLIIAIKMDNDELVSEIINNILEIVFLEFKTGISLKKSVSEPMQKLISHRNNGLVIPYNQLMMLKKTAFKRSLKEGLRYVFYVNKALLENEVSRKKDWVDDASQLFQLLSPAITTSVTSVEKIGSFSVGLAFTLVNIIFKIVEKFKDKLARERAAEVVESFRGEAGHIDLNAIKAIAKTFVERFENQIYQMAVSLGTDGNLHPNYDDGIVTFARIICWRITEHILQGKNKTINESNIPVIQGICNLMKKTENGFIKYFGEPQDIKAEQSVPLIQRCMLATWTETEGKDRAIRLDMNIEGQTSTWLGQDVLCNTGIRIKNENKCFIRKNHFNRHIGFCFGTKEEAMIRHYEDQEVLAELELENQHKYK